MSDATLDNLSDDDLSRAVLQALWPIPQVLVTGVIPIHQAEVDNARQRCAELREWLGKQSLSRRIHGAYEHWIEFCESSIIEAEDELRTGKKRGEFERGQQRWQDEQRRASAVALGLPKPTR